MNTKTIHPWGRRIVLAATLFILFTYLRGEGLARVVNVSEPVWGRKPVLAYFAFTAGLADEFKIGVRLNDAEFRIVQEVAQQEMSQIASLKQITDTIIADEQLTEAEKRSQIAEMGYNQSVEQIISAHQKELEAALDTGTYSRLVDWIEARWQIERVIHGANSSTKSPTGARTYTIYATHFDSNGSYAVALPDKCVKFADGGNSICSGSGYSTGETYKVKLTYANQTTTVSSFDSGPWNVDDNFWATLDDPHPRRLFTDLPLGMPEAQAAYNDDYNNGRDQYDRIVTAQFAIDLGDGVGSAIGVEPGTNAWIDVTFLWTEPWDSQPSEVITLLKPTNLTPDYTGDMCVTAWHRIFPLLVEGGQAAYLTLNVDTAAQSTNSAQWTPNLPSDGEYKVLAFIPSHGPIDWLCPASTINFDTGDAEYTIIHANGETTVSKNQGPMSNQYLDLGTYEFEAGTGGKAELSDLNDEANLSHTVAFSAMQFRKELPPPTATATPSPTPTPTPTPIPSPYVSVGVGVTTPGENITVPLQGGNLQSPGIGLAVVDVQYDPAVFDIFGCQSDPNGLFDSDTCQPDFDGDDIFPDIVRVTLNSAAGVADHPLFAYLTFAPVGSPGDFTWLELTLIQFLQPGGAAITADLFKGGICIAPCKNIGYLPVISK